MIHSKKDIIEQLKQNADRFYDWINRQDNQAFEAGPDGKWTTGQHLDHLIKSVQPLNKGFLLPKFAFRYLFGTPNRKERTYEELVNRYEEKLKLGGKASGRFIPPFVQVEDKDQMLRKFKNEHEKLMRRIRKWTETELDTYLIPHPLLGKLFVREMMFFTIYHLEHHLRILDENYKK